MIRDTLAITETRNVKFVGFRTVCTVRLSLSNLQPPHGIWTTKRLCSSLQIDPQVSVWFGHHHNSFTNQTYYTLLRSPTVAFICFVICTWFRSLGKRFVTHFVTSFTSRFFRQSCCVPSHLRSVPSQPPWQWFSLTYLLAKRTNTCLSTHNCLSHVQIRYLIQG